MKYIRLILFLTILFLAVGAVSAENIQANGTTFDDIQSAVDIANISDTVELEGTYVSDSSEINVLKPLTLQGKNGTVLDGAKKSRILNVEADNITIRDICFKNAKTTLNGGAISLKGNNITIINCTFISNEAYGGAAIHWIGRDGTISNCTFDKNTATAYGAAFMWDGPAVSSNRYNPFNLTGNESFKIENSRFTNNKADEGGAIYASPGYYFIWEDYTDGEIIRCLPTQIIGCEFSSNSASTGGAIYWVECTSSINTIHVNNLTVKRSKFSKNKADDSSAICLWGDNNNIIDCEFASNSATSSVAYICGDNISVSKSSFKSNTLKEKGSLIFDSNNMTVSDCEFGSNKAYDGPAICGGGSKIIISNSKFTSNTAKHWGAVCLNVCNLVIDRCQFSKNTAFEGGGLLLRGYNQTVKNSRFTSNKAGLYGGAVMWTSESTDYQINQIKNSKLTFEGNVFTSNTADLSGGAVRIYTLSLDSTPKIKSGDNLNMKVAFKNCNFTKNTAEFSGAINWDGVLTDSIKVYVGKMEINSCNFNSNKATLGGGGAVYLSGNGNKILNSNFNSNSGRDFGGGAVQAEGSSLQVKNSKFTGNTVRAEGGALYVKGSKLTVDNCVFTKNRANPGFGSENGGAILVRGKNSIIQNSLFKYNYALDYGGAIDIDGSGNVVKTSVFIGNTAEKGGAIYNNAKTGNICYCIFDNNREFDSNKYGKLKYLTGNAVYVKYKINNNFWGYNVKSGDFDVKNIASGKKPSTWVNLKITKGKLQFVNNNGKVVTQMPTFTFRLVDGKDKLIKTVKVEKGVGLTNTSKSFKVTTPSKVYVSKIKKNIKATSKLKAVHQTGKKITIKTFKKVRVTILVTNGKKVMPYHATANSKGIIKFDASVLNHGKNKLRIFVDDKKYTSKVVKSTVTIKKAKATVKAPKVTKKYKKKGYFKVTVKHKTTKKRVKNTNIAIKVYYSGGIPVVHVIKTNSKGVASLETQYMRKGTHTVKIISYGNYIMSGYSSIRIK